MRECPGRRVSGVLARVLGTQGGIPQKLKGFIVKMWVVLFIQQLFMDDRDQWMIMEITDMEMMDFW